eukprot:3932476-Rhodomonas_salina.2
MIYGCDTAIYACDAITFGCGASVYGHNASGHCCHASVGEGMQQMLQTAPPLTAAILPLMAARPLFIAATVP